jgi:hypothetical protein
VHIATTTLNPFLYRPNTFKQNIKAGTRRHYGTGIPEAKHKHSAESKLQHQPNLGITATRSEGKMRH